MSTKFLELHEKWMKTKRLPHAGLCCSIIDSERYPLDLFKPTNDDKKELLAEDTSTVFWAYGKSYGCLRQRAHNYTPLRQTIMLFCHHILNSK